jgi:hypothetical protein
MILVSFQQWSHEGKDKLTLYFWILLHEFSDFSFRPECIERTNIPAS